MSSKQPVRRSRRLKVAHSAIQKDSSPPSRATAKTAVVSAAQAESEKENVVNESLTPTRTRSVLSKGDLLLADVERIRLSAVKERRNASPKKAHAHLSAGKKPVKSRTALAAVGQKQVRATYAGYHAKINNKFDKIVDSMPVPFAKAPVQTYGGRRPRAVENSDSSAVHSLRAPLTKRMSDTSEDDQRGEDAENDGEEKWVAEESDEEDEHGDGDQDLSTEKQPARPRRKGPLSRVDEEAEAAKLDEFWKQQKSFWADVDETELAELAEDNVG